MSSPAFCKPLRQTFTIAADAEVTLEANPDDIVEEKLKEWKQVGINRLSIGVQSFFEEDLRWMNRAHTAQQAIGNLQLARKYFDNITIDLIYGTPTLPDEKWQHNVQQAIALGITHLSCYALTVEPGTALAHMINKHKTHRCKYRRPGPAVSAIDGLDAVPAGYEHYEISNFALPGMRSRHNSSYWQRRLVPGLGPSAHSFNGESRQWNIANNALYIKSLKEDKVPFEVEHLTSTQRLNEYIMTSCVLWKDWTWNMLPAVLAKKPPVKWSMEAKQFIETGKMQLNNGSLQLTKEGRLFADGIAAELFTPDLIFS